MFSDYRFTFTFSKNENMRVLKNMLLLLLCLIKTLSNSLNLIENGLIRETFKKEQPLVRPFVTDDSRVVGNKLFQIESWIRNDNKDVQHWTLAAYGPSNLLELTFGGVYGYATYHFQNNVTKKVFSYGFPLLQLKLLFKEYYPGDYPGIGVVFGSFLPFGYGAFMPPGYGSFGYLTLSQSFGSGDKVLIHGNLGANYIHNEGKEQFIKTWGIGSQLKVYKGMHAVMEIFSGDPYVPGTGIAYQLGFRHFFSEEFQIDGTFGEGLTGKIKIPFWFSAGIRLVFKKNP